MPPLRVSLPDAPRKLSFPFPPSRVSLPDPPRKLSFPDSPFNVFSPLLPLMVLSRSLPVAFTLEEPKRYKFSTLLEAVKVAEDQIKSVPSEEFSVTVSPELVTI